MKNLIIFLFLASSAGAQNFTSVTAYKIQDASGAGLASGQLCVVGVSPGGQIIPFTAGGGGMVHSLPVCTAVVNGAITPLSIANSNYTNPLNVAYILTVTDNISGQTVLSLGPAQITGSVWSMDTYTPALGSLPLIGSGPVGPAGANGAAATVTSNGANGDFTILGRMLTKLGPEMNVLAWGAICNGATDDTAAIQAALNAVPVSGATILFPPGVCKITGTLTPKNQGAPAFGYNLKLKGTGGEMWGAGSSTILAVMSTPAPMVSFNTVVSSNAEASNIEVEGLYFNANSSASYGIYADYVSGFRLSRSSVRGALTDNVHIGQNATVNYDIEVRDFYSNGAVVGAGLPVVNHAGLCFTNVSFPRVDNMVSDGSAYAIVGLNSNDGAITNGHFESARLSTIYLSGAGGGLWSITNNLILSYEGYDYTGIFQGNVDGITIISTGPGGLAQNTIANNHIAMSGNTGQIGDMAVVASLSASPSGTFAVNQTNLVTGSTSGATAYFWGYNAATKKALLKVQSGTFVSESITQASTGASAAIGAIQIPSSTGIDIQNALAQSVIGNTLLTNANIGIYLYNSAGSAVIGNQINALNYGIQRLGTGSGGSVIGNTIYAAGATAFFNAPGDSIYYSGNTVQAGSISLSGSDNLTGTDVFSASSGITLAGGVLATSNPSAANGLVANMYTAQAGTDASLGPIIFSLQSVPSATGSLRVGGISFITGNSGSRLPMILNGFGSVGAGASSIGSYGPNLIGTNVWDGVSLLQVNGAINFTGIKAASGSRTVCIDASGRLSSIAGACPSGT